MAFLITDPTAIYTALKERWVAHGIGHCLKKRYPGRDWIVRIDLDGGVATVLCPAISVDYGYVVHLDKPIQAIQQKALSGAGELLERFRLSRGTIPKAGEMAMLPKTPLGLTKYVKEGGY